MTFLQNKNSYLNVILTKTANISLMREELSKLNVILTWLVLE